MKIIKNKTNEKNVQTITILLNNGTEVEISEDGNGDVTDVRVMDYEERKYNSSVSSVSLLSSKRYCLAGISVHTRDIKSNQIKRRNRSYDDFNIKGVTFDNTDISIFHDK